MDLIGGLSNLKMDNVLSAVDKYVPGAQNKLKNLADKAKAYVNNVSELEMKVLEATNHEPWGPHGSAMQEITQCSFNSEGFYQIMGVVDQRLAEGPDNWRLVYKALLLLEYMCKHGPLAVAEALASYSRLSHLEKLRDRFEYKDPAGRDQGVNVRQRAGVLVGLVQDRDKLMEERDKAAKNKSKYTGVSSGSASRYGGFGGGSSSSSYGGSSAAYGSSGSSSFASARDYGGSGSSSGSFNRSSSSSAAYGGSSDAVAPAADPVEATRQRIARLKEQGVLDGADGSSSTVGPGLEGTGGDAGSPKKPKKLSEIKINPAISATFAKGGGLGLAPPPAGGRSAASSAGGAAAASSGIDLLGDLDVAVPAASSSTAAAAAGGDEWDGFASAPAAGSGGAAAAAADEWSAFDSAPSATVAGQKQKAGGVDVNALLGHIPTTTTASSGKAPLPLDDFCSIPVAAGTSSFVAAPAAAQPAAAADPFGPFVAPSGAATSSSSSFAAADPFAGATFSSGAPAGNGAADPFAASGVVHMVPQAPKHHAAAGPKLGPETAKAKDPFADLALL